jgi:two-component system response regulator YesN
MYDVCIVDDELLIQKSIAARLRASGIPVRVTGCADNAAGAVSLYWASRPDIFFVDINMPGLDGLSMVRQIREEDPGCTTKFIIITGYDDFAHLQEAIRCGVTDYLKKPISTEEFNRVFASVAGGIKRKERNSQTRLPGLVFYDEYLGEPPQILDGGTLIAAYSPKAGLFDGAALPLPAPSENGGEGGNACIREAGPVEKSIRKLWNEKSGQCCLSLAFQDVDNVRLYYMPGLTLSKWQISLGLNDLAAAECMSFVYVHPASEGLDLLTERLEQSANRHFFRAGIEECIPKKIIPSADMGLLDYALEHGQGDSARAAVKVYFYETLKGDSFAPGLSPLYRQIVLLLINKYMAHEMPIPDSLKPELSLFALCRYRSTESLLTRLCGMTVSLAQKIAARQGRGELVRDVCQFLQQKYQENINLNYAADLFFVTPPYLSRRFKEKTGTTFGEYLEDIRMEKAQEYLVNTEAPIADISERVGYQDQAYFAKVFKQKYHLSPSEYRFKNKP